VELDDRVGTSFGRRAVEWELKGVPVRIEIGPRDLAAGNATLVRRDTAEKVVVGVDAVAAAAAASLDDIQVVLHRQATEMREARTADVTSLADAQEAAQSGFARVPWDVVRDGEVRLAQAGVTVRCLQRHDGDLPASSSEADLVATVAKAY